MFRSVYSKLQCIETPSLETKVMNMLGNEINL